jgi:hypothetical protein
MSFENGSKNVLLVATSILAYYFNYLGIDVRRNCTEAFVFVDKTWLVTSTCLDLAMEKNISFAIS